MRMIKRAKYRMIRRLLKKQSGPQFPSLFALRLEYQAELKTELPDYKLRDDVEGHMWDVTTSPSHFLLSPESGSPALAGIILPF